MNASRALAHSIFDAWHTAAGHPRLRAGNGLSLPSLNQFSALAEAILRSRGIDPDEDSAAVDRPVEMRIPSARLCLEPHLNRLRLPVRAGIVGVNKKLQALGRIEIGFIADFDRLAIELYLHEWGILAAVLDDKDDRVVCGKITFHLLAVEAEQMRVARGIVVHVPRILGLHVNPIEALAADGEQRGVTPATDREQFGLRLLGACVLDLLTRFRRFSFARLLRVINHPHRDRGAKPNRGEHVESHTAEVGKNHGAAQ